MARRALDTNVLISFWWTRANAHGRGITVSIARRWVEQLRELHGNARIVTPVAIEFLCGTKNGNELRLWRAFVDAFDLADQGNVTKADWALARRLAERVPRDGLRRQMGDCLIRAICDRLHLEVVTGEKRFAGAGPG